AESITAHRKIQDRTLGRRAIQGVFRYRHLAHRIFFDARFYAFHRAYFEERRAAESTAPFPLATAALRKTVMNIGGMFCREHSDAALAKSVACWRSSFVT